MKRFLTPCGELKPHYILLLFVLCLASAVAFPSCTSSRVPRRYQHSAATLTEASQLHQRYTDPRIKRSEPQHSRIR